MKTNELLRRWGLLACLAVFAAGIVPARAAFYQPGNIVSNFTLINRLAWTNESGRVFGAGAPLQLSDFDGKILFMEFFDAT